MSARQYLGTEVLKGWFGAGGAYLDRWLRHSLDVLRLPEAPAGQAWWQRPGVGVQYQIEYRPGMDWDRDYTAYNRSMADENGKLRFNGPFCQVEDWVALSREVGLDYHSMQAKWHDGICYFDTKLTEWKTAEDYAGRFAEASRRAGIPFMYYYSTVFDHNPQFDDIQPNREATVSFLALPRNERYEEYLRGHFREIMERYRPDGMWLDWYWPGDGSTRAAVDFFRRRCPQTVLSFNSSSLFLLSQRDLHYTSYEAHDLGGAYFKLVKLPAATLPIVESAWKWANLNRRIFGHPWELITPAGTWWQNPAVRADPDELTRMAAVTMACGGKLSIGVLSQLDGALYPEHVAQLRTLGRWCKPRRELFAAAQPLRYRGVQPPGVRCYGRPADCVASRLGGDTLLHVIGLDAPPQPLTVELARRHWPGVRSVRLEPEGRELRIEQTATACVVQLDADAVDPVDTILRLRGA